VAAVVLDPVAVADFAQHVEIVTRAHLEALRFEQLAGILEEFEPLVQLDLDRVDRAAQLFLGRDEVLGRERS
jgi:hypothetical protein